jgi:hypothetical protein
LAETDAAGYVFNMSGPDLDTVTARRAAVASELSALEKMRAEMEAEDHDLVVAERVLKRLAVLPRAEAPLSNHDIDALSREA